MSRLTEAQKRFLHAIKTTLIPFSVLMEEHKITHLRLHQWMHSPRFAREMRAIETTLKEGRELDVCRGGAESAKKLIREVSHSKSGEATERDRATWHCCVKLSRIPRQPRWKRRKKRKNSPGVARASDDPVHPDVAHRVHELNAALARAHTVPVGGAEDPATAPG